MTTLIPCQTHDIEPDLEWLKEHYHEVNGEPMTRAETKWWHTWMTASVGLNLAYRLGNCFMYLAPQNMDSMAVIAVRFPDDEWLNAGLLYSQVHEDHNPDIYVPLGQHWLDMLAFVRLVSVRKWNNGLRKDIVLMRTECNPSFVQEYVHE